MPELELRRLLDDMLEIKNIHKSFGKNEILKGVDLKIDKGDVVVIFRTKWFWKNNITTLHKLS